MFGEKTIIGERVVSVLKNRITLPNFTGAEIGEEVQAQFVTTFDEEEQKNRVHHLNIYSVYDFNKRLNSIDESLREAYASKRISYQQYNNYRRYFYGFLSFMPERVDNQRRVHLEPRIITNLNINKTAFIVGVQRHLELYPNFEPYNQTLKELYCECTEIEITSLIKKQKFITDRVELSNIRPLKIKDYLCIFKVPSLLLKGNEQGNGYVLFTDDINYTHLDRVIDSDNNLIYRKEPTSPLIML